MNNIFSIGFSKIMQGIEIFLNNNQGNSNAISGNILGVSEILARQKNKNPAQGGIL